MMNLGQYIQQYCMENDITIKQFAEKSGITRSYIFVLKNKTRNPGVETLRKAAKAMGMSYDDLLHKVDIGLPDSVKNELVAHEVSLYKATPLTDENIIGSVAVSKEYKDAYFAYKIDSNDMNPLVYKNSTVIVKLSDKVENDDLVVANINGETICRKYMKNDSHVQFIALNPKAKTITISNRVAKEFKDKKVSKTDMVIYGKVVEVRFNL